MMGIITINAGDRIVTFDTFDETDNVKCLWQNNAVKRQRQNNDVEQK